MNKNDFISIGKFVFRTWNRLGANLYKRQRFKTIFSPHPEYRIPLHKKVEKRHIEIWKRIRQDINLDTLRICGNISNKENPFIIPEEVFASDVEPCLCEKQRKIQYFENKSFYNKWFNKNDVFPKCYLHNIEGNFFDEYYKDISRVKIDNLLIDIPYPVVFKPNIDSYGGRGIQFPSNIRELKKIMKNKNNYVIQEKIIPSPFFEKYNQYGLNTIRVNLYRSVKTNKICYLHSALRMGRKGKLDNVTSGGIQCYIDNQGFLNDYAVDIFGSKYQVHPDSKIKFSKEEKIPLFEEMKKTAINIAEELYLARLISLDICLDINSKWRVIEINLHDITTEFSQYAGEPFFGPYTKEVIDYCISHPWWRCRIM